MSPEFAYFFALASSTCFAVASLIFADLSRRVSPLWMNAFKAVAAWIFFSLTLLVLQQPIPTSSAIVGALLISGALGLGLGDVFLLTAYARMGAARTLILFGFQPFFIGVAAHWLFNQPMTWIRMLALVFFMGCLFAFSLEKFRQQGHWEVYGLVAALLGVLLDNTGLLISRWAFEQDASMSAFQANFWRCLGAMIFFLILNRFRSVQLVSGWRTLTIDMRQLATLSAFLGTYLSLFLYLTAVKIGHLASISALGVAGPIITSGLECAYERRWPSKYLLVALLLFTIGFVILNVGT